MINNVDDMIKENEYAHVRINNVDEMIKENEYAHVRINNVDDTIGQINNCGSLFN